MESNERPPMQSERVDRPATSSGDMGRAQETAPAVDAGRAEGAGPEAETGRERFTRRVRRGRLYFYAFAAVALLVFLVALAVANTRHVTVDWVFGTSSVSLVWLVLFSAVLGWLFGIVISVLFHWRTRERRAQGAAPAGDSVHR